VRLATPRVAPVRGAKVFIWRKVVPPARVALPAELSRSPRQLGVIHINGCLNFTTTQGKVNSPRKTQGEGSLGYPSPYKWGLRQVSVFLLRYWAAKPVQNIGRIFCGCHLSLYTSADISSIGNNYGALLYIIIAHISSIAFITFCRALCNREKTYFDREGPGCSSVF